MPSRPSASMTAPAPRRSSTAKRSARRHPVRELPRGDHGDARARAAALLLGEHRSGDGRGVAERAEQHERAACGSSPAASATAAPLIEVAGRRHPVRTSAPCSTAWITVDENRSTSTTTTMSAGASRARPSTPHSRRTWYVD